VNICGKLNYEFTTASPPLSTSTSATVETKGDEKAAVSSTTAQPVSDSKDSEVATNTVTTSSSSSTKRSTNSNDVRHVKITLDRSYVAAAASSTVVYPSAPLVNDVDISFGKSSDHRTIVTVYAGDCIDCARSLQLQGLKPFVLSNVSYLLALSIFGDSHTFRTDWADIDMANQSTPGGGWEGGAGAQEENLFRRTLYSISLRGDGYPLTDQGAAYSPNVIVFRSNEALVPTHYMSHPYITV
jgi:hypothetical protein